MLVHTKPNYLDWKKKRSALNARSETKNLQIIPLIEKKNIPDTFTLYTTKTGFKSGNET